MRKATKVLLLISFIVAFCGIVVWLALSIRRFVLASDPAKLLDYLIKSGMTGVNINSVKTTYVPLYYAVGIIYLIAAIFSIPEGIICTLTFKKFLKGEEDKKSYKVNSILMIVFGALSVELPIVPAVFLLAMGEENFKNK